MSVQEIAEQIAELTPEQQAEVLDFAAFIRERRRAAGAPTMLPEAGKRKPNYMALAGLWAHRTDITDGAEWVHNLRRSKEWSRFNL